MRRALTTAAILMAILFALGAARDSEAAQLPHPQDAIPLAGTPYIAFDRDDFGTYGPFTAIFPDPFGHQFWCHSTIYPCHGSFELTLIFPFEIKGISGHLQTCNTYTGYLNIDIGGSLVPTGYSEDDQCQGVALGYDGFFEATFAPTDQLVITWVDGLISTDEIIAFIFYDVHVAPVPEPATLTLFCLAVVFTLARNRRCAVS